MKEKEENEEKAKKENEEKEKKYLEEKKKLSEENEKLKEDNEKLKEINTKLKEEYESKFKKIKKLEENKALLKKLLDEIKKHEGENPPAS